MTISPCTACTKHGIDIYCHGKCDSYKAFRAEADNRSAKNNAEKQTHLMFVDIERNRDQRIKKRNHLTSSNPCRATF